MGCIVSSVSEVLSSVFSTDDSLSVSAGWVSWAVGFGLSLVFCWLLPACVCPPPLFPSAPTFFPDSISFPGSPRPLTSIMWVLMDFKFSDGT